MDKRYCIFDMDGTLLDTMGYWYQLDEDFLRLKGGEPDERLKRAGFMTMLQLAEFFMENYGLKGPAQQLVDEMNAMMDRRYRFEAQPKQGVVEYLRALHEKGVKLSVATATDARLAKAAFARLGILELFECVVSCEDVGFSKARPDVYLEAARRMGAKPQDIAVFEDDLAAAQTAKQAGFYTVAVYDKYAEHWEELRAFCDEAMETFPCCI